MAKNTNGPFSTELSSSSIAPCSPNEIAISSEDCVEGDVEKWLEDEVAGFRVWQLAGIILSILLTVVIGLCCCIRFRVPRTKQDIEADYIRKKITKSFRNELATISNTEMDEMDLRKGSYKYVLKISLNAHDVVEYSSLGHYSYKIRCRYTYAGKTERRNHESEYPLRISCKGQCSF